ncbi:MAG: DUF6622 family protein [Burkholderiaceae bacterium]|jgi:hypothetical protein
MIMDILTHTPVWIWAVLALLVYRGIAARRDRELPLWGLAVLPVVLLGLAIEGIRGHFGTSPLPYAVWSGAAVIGAIIGSRTLAQDAVALGQRGVLVRGSWFPLVLILAIFFTKYCTEVVFALQPVRMHEPDAVAAVSALYGLLSGLFLGRLIRTLILYRGLTSHASDGMLATDPSL